MWARTRWPLVNSTRNIALGRASTTAPSISMTPSFFAIASLSLNALVAGLAWIVMKLHAARDSTRHQGSTLWYVVAFWQFPPIIRGAPLRDPVPAKGGDGCRRAGQARGTGVMPRGARP